MMKWTENEPSNNQKQKVCSNCKCHYIEGDRYCRFCGAPLGQPAFIEEHFATIYGPPPIARSHKCEVCGYEWETKEMIDKECYCPKCGGAAPITKEFNLW